MTLLIVEDNETDMLLYRKLLANLSHGFSDVVQVKSIQACLEYLEGNTPACCLLDNVLPDGDAAKLVRHISQASDGPAFPIIVSTSSGSTQHAVELLQLGAQDYILKQDLSESCLMHAFQNAQRIFEMQTKLYQLAHTDSLTGLINRSLFMDRVDQSVKISQREAHETCLLYLDLDNFKLINDTYGHESGDRVLQDVAKRLQRAIRNSDSAARLGGDEFVILLPNTKPIEGEYVAEKILLEIQKPIHISEATLHITPSIGMVSYPSTAESADELLILADRALYRAKKQGRAQCVKFNQDAKAHWQRRRKVINALPHALLHHQICFAYQPILESKTLTCELTEALVRWHHDSEWINPQEIIKYIFEADLVIEFHKLLFRTTLSQLKQWQQANPNLCMSLNLSANIIHNQRIINILNNTVDQLGLSPSSIVVEITETHFMKNIQSTRSMLHQLRNRGFQIAIDDYGTGYSSMEYLTDLPCNKVKIDKKFFRIAPDVSSRKRDKNSAIVAATTLLSHELGLTTVAEGIDCEEKRLKAIELGCDFLQGFWLAQPTMGCESWSQFLGRALNAQSGLFGSSDQSAG